MTDAPLGDEPEIVPGGGSWITHALVADGAARLVLAEADEVADVLREAHALGPKAAEIAAHATVAAFLLSAFAKGDERLTLQLALERPAGRYIGELDPSRRFRGRWSPAELPPGVDLDALHGLLLAVKHDGTREVYRGITQVQGTSIVGALRAYLRDSAQLHGVLIFAVALDSDGRVTFARGALIERLPPHPDLPALDPSAFAARFGGLESADPTPVLHELAAGRLLGEPIRVLEHKPVFWRCSCSRERVLATLAGLSADELRAMADEDGGARVDCHFCAATYEVSRDRLLAMAGDQEPAR